MLAALYVAGSTSTQAASYFANAVNWGKMTIGSILEWIGPASDWYGIGNDYEASTFFTEAHSYLLNSETQYMNNINKTYRKTWRMPNGTGGYNQYWETQYTINGVNQLIDYNPFEVVAAKNKYSCYSTTPVTMGSKVDVTSTTYIQHFISKFANNRPANDSPNGFSVTCQYSLKVLPTGCIPGPNEGMQHLFNTMYFQTRGSFTTGIPIPYDNREVTIMDAGLMVNN